MEPSATIAGNGVAAYSGDGGPATQASLTYPEPVAFDSAGSYYIADEGANVVRKVDTTGKISTAAGTGKFPGTIPVQADISRRTLEYLDRLAAVKSNDSGLRLELGQGYLRLGTILGGKFGLGDSLGNHAMAIETDRKAFEIVKPPVRERPNDASARRTLASIEEQLGGALSATGQYNEAFQWLQESAGTFDQIAAANPDDLRSLQDAGRAWQTFGKLMSEKSGYITFNADAPLANLKRSVKYLEAALKIDSANPQVIQSLAETYEYIGRIEATPDPQKGIEAYSTALSLLSRLPERERQTVEVQQLRARMLVLLGWGQGQLGDFKRALANLEEARPILDAQAAADPQNVGAQFRRVDLYRSLGLVSGYTGDNRAALQNLQKAVGILDVIVKRDPAMLFIRSSAQNCKGESPTYCYRPAQRRKRCPMRKPALNTFGRSGTVPMQHRSN